MKMLFWILEWAVSAAALLATAYVVPGFDVPNFKRAMVAVLFIGLANLFVRPIMLLLTLPLNILTLGLFTLVVNGAVLKLCAVLAPNHLHITSWSAAIIGAIVLSLVNAIFHYLTL